MCGVGIESTMIEYCVNCEKETPYDRFDDINNSELIKVARED